MIYSLLIVAVIRFTFQQTPEEIIDGILNQMTIQEKAGQMVQAERVDILPGDITNYTLGSILSGGGSVPTDSTGASQNKNTPEGWVELMNSYVVETEKTRLKIPIIYGMDAVHGNNNVRGATIFPHNINYGGTYVGDPLIGIKNIQEEGKVVQEEIYAVGIPWNFGPVLGNPQNQHWGRTYEGYSENIAVPTVLGPEYIKSIQSTNQVSGCMKHYIGEGYTINGTNRGNAILTEEEIRGILAPYKAAVEAGAWTLMPSFSSINGTVCTENSFILTTLLKDELKFDGFTISDWDAVRNVSGATYKDKVRNAIKAGLDMVMATTDVAHTAAESRQHWIDTYEAIVEGVTATPPTLSEDRVNDAVRRILRIKQRLGLLNGTPNWLPGEVGTPAHRAIARRHVSDSLVLLKNNGVLGKLASYKNILVAGQAADDIGVQCGGWTVTWQGGHGPIVPGTTILEGFRKVATDKNFVYSENANLTGNYDAVVVVVGEEPYAEWFGDRAGNITLRTGSPIATPDASLGLSETANDTLVLENAYKLGVPVIVILISGRPLHLLPVDRWDAFIAAFLPGSEAGLGIADVLFGERDFVAKLSYTWRKADLAVGNDAPENILYPCGYGLKKGESDKQTPDPPSTVAEFVANMTLEEKAGQMVQAERVDILPGDIRKYNLGSILSGGGSVPTDSKDASKNRNNPEGWVELLDGLLEESSQTRLGIPIIYGMDCVHGNNNVLGATVFPHNINYGGTYVGDPSIGIKNIQEEAKVVQEEVHAVGIPWNFGPVLGNPQNQHWGRTYEGYSENISVPTALGPAYIKAIQSTNQVSGCMKHYIGEGYTVNGTNRGNAILTEEEIRGILAPYKAAVEAGAWTLMPSFSAINGTVCTENKFILTTLLKDELKFDGFTVSDWDAVRNVSGLTYKDKVINAINAGLDMVMATTDVAHTAAESRQHWIDTYEAIIEGVRNNTITQARVDDAVTRILRIKERLGLLSGRPTLIPGEIGTPANRAIARRHVSDSLVLLKNDGILNKLGSFNNILVAGQAADDIGMQCGGWTITWQGGHGAIVPGTTVLDGLRKVASDKNFVYSENANLTGSYDAVIVVVGEEPYAEWFGDRAGNITLRTGSAVPTPDTTLGLSETANDTLVLENAYKLGVPVIVILISGRPLHNLEVDKWNAFIAAWLPGSEAGLGIADILFGPRDFVAKTSYTWHKSDGGEVLYPFGFGLTKAETAEPSSAPKKEVNKNAVIIVLAVLLGVFVLIALILLIAVIVKSTGKNSNYKTINGD